ncbi:MAG: zinc-dependent metalloprotease [Fimbriimonadaceae bacterium]
MLSRARSFAFAFLLMAVVSSAICAPNQEKVLLRFKPESGQTAKSKGTSKIKFDGGGQDVTIQDEGTYANEVLSVEDGKFVLKSTTLASKTTINGEPIPPEEDEGFSKITYAPNGLILNVEHEPAIDDELQLTLENSLAIGAAIVFKDEPVGTGDTWAHEYAANAELKTAAATAKFTVLGMEELDGVAVVKIKMEWAEKSGSPALKIVSTQWIEVASGDSIKSEVKATGAKFDFGLGSPVILSIDSTSERTSGGLVQSDTNKTEQDKGAIDEAVDGFEKVEGALTLWKKEEEGQIKLKLELKKSQLNKMMMMQTTASSGLADGRLAAGDPISDLVFEFRKLPNKRLAMYVPNFFYRADNKLPIAKAVQRSFPDAIVESFAIEAEQEDRDSILVDVSDLFRGDVGRITEMLAGGGNPLLGGGGNAYILDRENSYLSQVKNFPKNLVVESTMNFIGRGGGNPLAALGGGTKNADDRSVIVRVEYNIFALPIDDGFQPRVFDPRVGFFTNDYQDFSDSTAIDQKVMFINRWNLVKQDPDAPVSDPVEPIVFWIDNAVPVEYRASVKMAIENWNKAFLEAGFSNAVVANQMPDDADFDHADMRYNVVRWVASPSNAYAIALFRTNPLTGEILNGSVTVDANIVRAFASEYGEFVRPEAWQSRLAKRLASLSQNYGPGKCDVLAEGNLNMYAGMLASAQMSGLSRDEFINQFIRWVVTHEMGHMMGLRHNFVASTLLSLDQLGDKTTVENEGTAASVMDYVAFNPSALKKQSVNFYGNTVGRYDQWAIKYGYTPFANKDSNEEKYDLSQIAQMGSREGLTWLGDEYADSIDPYVTRFDLGTDPLAYWTKMGDVSHDLLMRLPETSIKPGEGYYKFTRDFESLIGMYARSSNELTRFIGGVRRSAAFPNDPGAKKPIVNIPGKTQRAALDQIVKMVFAPTALEFPKGYFKNLTMNPKGEFIEMMIGGQSDYPMRDSISGIQTGTLSSLLEAGVLSRLINAEFEAEKGEDVLTLVQLFTKLKSAIWSEVPGTSIVSPLRRDLQRSYADQLMAMVLEKDSAPAEAIAVARFQLNELLAELKDAAKRNKDPMTSMHYSDLTDRIEKALAARPTVGSSGGGGGLSLADLLGGGLKKNSGSGGLH